MLRSAVMPCSVVVRYQHFRGPTTTLYGIKTQRPWLKSSQPQKPQIKNSSPRVTEEQRNFSSFTTIQKLC